jgi:hypothetical protein
VEGTRRLGGWTSARCVVSEVCRRSNVETGNWRRYCIHGVAKSVCEIGSGKRLHACILKDDSRDILFLPELPSIKVQLWISRNPSHISTTTHLLFRQNDQKEWRYNNYPQHSSQHPTMIAGYWEAIAMDHSCVCTPQKLMI